MTKEEKQDIAAECRRLMAEARKEGAGYRTIAKGKVAEVALDALTAQPVKLPDNEYSLDDKMMVFRDEVIAAIRAAGYEVQE